MLHHVAHFHTLLRRLPRLDDLWILPTSTLPFCFIACMHWLNITSSRPAKRCFPKDRMKITSDAGEGFIGGSKKYAIHRAKEYWVGEEVPETSDLAA